MGETNPSTANPEESVDNSAEGGEDVSEDKNLEAESTTDQGTEVEEKINKVNEITGRDFKTWEEFQEHYKNLNSLVGDEKIVEIRKKATDYDKITKQAGEDVNKFIETDDGKKVVAEVKEDAKEDRMKEIEETLEEERFLRKNEGLEQYVENIRSVARDKNISLQEAYDNHLKELIASKLESDKTKKEEHSIGVESKSRLSSSKGKNLEQLSKDALEKPSDETHEKLVEEFFSDEK